MCRRPGMSACHDAYWPPMGFRWLSIVLQSRKKVSNGSLIGLDKHQERKIDKHGMDRCW